jgi:hypothetical protein
MNRPLQARKLLTIVCEAALESRLEKELPRLGAHGYTISDARGSGAHGRRDAAWPNSANIRVEVLCDEAVADSVAHHLETHYFNTYQMVIFVSDVQVLRPEKF